jgi:hypothetical protein
MEDDMSEAHILAIDGLKAANDEQQSGIDIIRRALRAPARQVAENVGEKGAYIVVKLLDAACVASLLITTQALVAEIPRKRVGVRTRRGLLTGGRVPA